MLDLGIVDFSVSDDAFHSYKGDESPGATAYRAAKKLGLPSAKICIEPPTVALTSDRSSDKGRLVGVVEFSSRAGLQRISLLVCQCGRGRS